jgi:hypothetical protein
MLLFAPGEHQKIERHCKNHPDNKALNGACLEWVLRKGFWIYPDSLSHTSARAGIYLKDLQILWSESLQDFVRLFHPQPLSRLFPLNAVSL